jgi:putative membrane-bound dehydrogenase-like protein
MKTPGLLSRLLPHLFLAWVAAAPPLALAESLFDGKTLNGWEGDSAWWRVQDGAITGGSVTEKVPRNFFLATKRSFQNFDLKLKLKLTGVPNTGMINSGVQIRSLRVPNNTEMSGYQVDAGDGWWGKLYDESRRNKVVAEPTNLAAVNAAVKSGEWNEYRIRTEGPRIRSWINGVAALDYTESEANIAQDGHIAIQIHAGGIALVQVKDVEIAELSPTPGAPTWQKVGLPKPREPNAKKAPATTPKKSADGRDTNATKTGRDISYNAITDGPRSPDEQRHAFRLPVGFEIELVAAESDGIGKFITVAWDASMRLWTMTALEYPVDANENQAASDALFARGGRDRVVVFDDVYGASVGAAARPRIFADGLVMPLGVQPYKDGAYVQYGHDIRFYRDTDGDGRADRHDVVLTGFGTQDSHLFPHQFLRQPGDWMFVAQGAFNYSNVRRPGGLAFADGSNEASFNQCKLARFRLDGSQWENVTAGPQNIWGLVTSREGETFMQEANDMGYPVIPYQPGIHVRTSSKEKLRPYQPLMPPPLAPAQMGGTGLSGLALAEDGDGIFRKVGAPKGADEKIFFLANPITGTVQTVKAASDGGRYRFEKLPDFITCDDRWFRPIAIHFGPDGCLYLVDWYNKIISHNEVPREHPDRDKSRGRIWRVRHRDQPRVTPPNLARLDDHALVGQLGAPNALVARLAWLEIGDRRALRLVPDLETIVADRNSAAGRRLGALWALENLTTVDTALLRALAADANPNFRREAARVAGAHSRPEAEFLELMTPLIGDTQPSVRAAAGDALRRIRNPSTHVMALAARLGRESLAAGGEWERYEREFERYLARWAMELNPGPTLTLLNSVEGRALPLENRILATLALGGKAAAIGVARLTRELRRPLDGEEVRALAAHFDEPAVSDALTAALGAPESRAAVLRALLELRTSLDPARLNDALSAATRLQLVSGSASDRLLGAEVAGAFKLVPVEPELVSILRAHWREPKQPLALAAVRALREMSAGPTDLLDEIARSGGALPLRDAALAALAASKRADASERLVRLLPKLSPTQRGNAIYALAGTTTGARALLDGLREGHVASTDLGVSTVDKLRTILPRDEQVAALWKRLGGDASRVLRLNGGDADYAATQLTLKGPFTIECWAKLDAPISNQDGILSAPGQLDLNFHAGQFRVWVGGGVKDVVIATKKTTPGVWTHYAVTRDAGGVFQIFINGELNATSAITHTGGFTGLDVGRTNPTSGGTAGWLAEFRVWNTARSVREIRENFDRSHAGEPEGVRPATLVAVLTGANWGPLQGNARIEIAEDMPTLLTQTEAAAQAEKFARFRTLANVRGNPERGRELFTAICLACHHQGGKGGQIAPALDGVGLTGVDALLRNLLTPNAAMESAYQTFRVVTKDGTVTDGFLVEQNPAAVVLRFPGSEDRRIARRDVQSAAFLRRSLMPEGLLESMTSEQVSDLFAHLLSLK